MFAKFRGAKYLKVENRQLNVLRIYGREIFRPILNRQIDKCKTAELF